MNILLYVYVLLTGSTRPPSPGNTISAGCPVKKSTGMHRDGQDDLISGKPRRHTKMIGWPNVGLDERPEFLW